MGRWSKASNTKSGKRRFRIDSSKQTRAQAVEASAVVDLSAIEVAYHDLIKTSVFEIDSD